MPIGIALLPRAETEGELARNRGKTRIEIEGLLYTGREAWLGRIFTRFL
jgi:hypothetical protein